MTYHNFFLLVFSFFFFLFRQCDLHGNLNPLAPMCALSLSISPTLFFTGFWKSSHVNASQPVEISIRLPAEEPLSIACRIAWVGVSIMLVVYVCMVVSYEMCIVLYMRRCIMACNGVRSPPDAFCLLDLLTFCATLHFLP